MRAFQALLWLGLLLGGLAAGLVLLVFGAAGATIACALVLIPFALAKAISEMCKL